MEFVLKSLFFFRQETSKKDRVPGAKYVTFCQNCLTCTGGFSEFCLKFTVCSFFDKNHNFSF